MDSQDTNNFSSSSPHRLPTLSASQALRDLKSLHKSTVSTGISSLDAILQNQVIGPLKQQSHQDVAAGLTRGQVTEFYGPPGVGKTAVAAQICASALRSGGVVVWVDASDMLVGSRLADILSGDTSTPKDAYETATSTAHGQEISELLLNFHHFTAPTLPHLLALLIHPCPTFPPKGTSIIVVDPVSAVFATAFPKVSSKINYMQKPGTKNDQAHWVTNRRWAVMGDFISNIGKLAAVHDIAVLLTSQTTTRIKPEMGAIVHPSISSTAWDGGVSNRIVLYRDWILPKADGSSKGKHAQNARFAAVIKVKGVSLETLNNIIPFTIEKYGLREIFIGPESIQPIVSPLIHGRSLKRKRDEIADSQSEDDEFASDEDFGWAGDDDPLATEAPPG